MQLDRINFRKGNISAGTGLHADELVLEILWKFWEARLLQFPLGPGSGGELMKVSRLPSRSHRGTSRTCTCQKIR